LIRRAGFGIDRGRELIKALGGVLGVVCAAVVSLALPGRPAAASAVMHCGAERWAIKTLRDADSAKINFAWKRTTVRVMRRRKPPEHLGAERIWPLEFQSYRIEAELVTAIREADSDIHLVIVDPGARARTSMIVELPDPACTLRGFGRNTMRRARRDFEHACGLPSRKGWALDGRATITGVGFWDFDHGQKGVAPNAIELHPVLGFDALSCRRQPARR
jgi:hypothetical protein